MRFLKVIFGLAAVVMVLTGCGGGSSSTASTSPSASSAGSSGASSSSTDSSSTSSSSTSSSSTGSSSTGSSSTGSSTGSSPSTPPATGTASLSWSAPTTNSDGSALTDLAGYHIHYGTSASSLTNEVNVASASAVSYQVSNLATGTWYFAVTSYTSSGLESSLSTVVSKTIS